MYDSLPRSLKEPTLVRSRKEDPELQRERAELTRSKTPSQLAEFGGIRDIPIPGRSEAKARHKRCGVAFDASIAFLFFFVVAVVICYLLLATIRVQLLFLLLLLLLFAAS